MFKIKGFVGKVLSLASHMQNMKAKVKVFFSKDGQGHKFKIYRTVEKTLS